MPNFEVLDARTASALNRIIHSSHFKRRSSLEEQKALKEDRFLRGRQIAYLIYEYFPVTGANDSVENYADLFATSLQNDDVQEFDSKWDGILLTMTKIPPDDILEGLYNLRIRESEKLKTVLELYDLEIHQKNASRTRSPRGKSPSGRMFRLPCKDYLKGTCTNSFCEKWHPPECLFYKTKSGCRFGEECSYAHRRFEDQPSKRSKKNDDKSAVALVEEE